MKRETLREFCEREIAEAGDWSEGDHGAVGLHLSDGRTAYPGRPGGNQMKYVKLIKLFVTISGTQLRAMAELDRELLAVEHARDETQQA
jgi:hypothetical protein